MGINELTLYIKETNSYVPNENLATLSNAILDSKDLHEACIVLERWLDKYGVSLISVKIQDTAADGDCIRPYLNLPGDTAGVCAAFQHAPGCPFAREAKKRLEAFDTCEIDRSLYPTFLERRFFKLFDDTEHDHIAVVPILVGRAFAQFNIGLSNKRFQGHLKALILETIAQVMPALVRRFPEIATIFDKKHLNQLEKSTITMVCLGQDMTDVQRELGLSQFTIQRIMQSAAKKLAAANQQQLIYKAILLGEIDCSASVGLLTTGINRTLNDCLRPD